MRWDAARQQEWVEHHDGPVPDAPDLFWRVLAGLLGALAGLVLVVAYVHYRTH